MNWGIEDLLAAAALFGTGAISLFIIFRSGLSGWVRLTLAAAVVFVALVIWADLAVGIF